MLKEVDNLIDGADRGLGCSSGIVAPWESSAIRHSVSLSTAAILRPARGRWKIGSTSIGEWR